MMALFVQLLTSSLSGITVVGVFLLTDARTTCGESILGLDFCLLMAAYLTLGGRSYGRRLLETVVERY